MPWRGEHTSCISGVRTVCACKGKRLGFDDALDVWGVHGMGGFMGTVLLPGGNNISMFFPVMSSADAPRHLSVAMKLSARRCLGLAIVM